MEQRIPDLFFPIGTNGPALLQIEEAKAVCRQRAVLERCLEWALEGGMDWGVCGGLTEEERRAVKRRRAREARTRLRPRLHPPT
ncbi:WhiB family transcriptional regulator, partial [Streptomyces sp. NPDC059389]|uniref:WhiB family transcriptional regulator n=1 Tax=Streptomyces sp. NPDC059389 TaxID=3346818 RepID=UPI0036AFDA33